MEYKIFIDGKAGTAGLELEMLLRNRSDIHILEISEEKRKDIDEKIKLMEEADLTFLCLPDEAAVEMAEVASDYTKIIDTSTAHRTDVGWVYGLPELGYREDIRNSLRVANPGCHATAFLLGARPLIDAGVIEQDELLSVVSVTGYSGGGKKMIADYESDNRGFELESPGQYGVNQKHKHLPEMKKYGKLKNYPSFMPIVSNYYRGMATSIPLQGKGSIKNIQKIFIEYYKDEALTEISQDVNPTIYANELAGKNGAKIYIYGSEDRAVVTTLIDNLGKGAAGAAVQNMNIMLGTDELKGLI